MGIEQKITDLQRTSAEQTAASQALSQEVAGKMGEIDKKVDESIAQFSAAFPIEFARHTNRTVYIDPTAGTDTQGSKVYQTLKYALNDNSFVQALVIVLRGDVLFNKSYLVTNRYLSINLGGWTLSRTKHNAMFNGEYNAYVKIFNGEIDFNLDEPELVLPGAGVCPFFYTVDTVMTLILGDRDGWAGERYKGGLKIKSNSPHLVTAVGSHINYRTHACRFELQGGAESCNMIYAASGGSIQQYSPYNVAADTGFIWSYE
ncbi:hypothetical protein F2Z80_16425 [Vibrio fortis]|uniref:Uncharacterized protein n=1 Tax=Vibrio fortis TaxID=212667 RepID=A0A5N3S1S9_9VIBR|nr:hypothetical protein [Vibrio fortis]KAB0300710.1 hypothetical protein F2Z80_16425 [Vibrio fortis]